MEWREKLRATITDLSEDKVSVEITILNEVSLGILYYENPKLGWSKKPIMPTRWRCVDAKLEGLYVWGGESLTPRDLMEWAQQRVLEHKGKKLNDVIENPESNGETEDNQE
jgi:hypothetical protein